jgi:hypothetical protein
MLPPPSSGLYPLELRPNHTRDYSIRRKREGILRLIQGTQANATFVLLHEMSRTKSDAFSQVESVLTNTFHRTEPGVIVDSRVGLIPF